MTYSPCNERRMYKCQDRLLRQLGILTSRMGILSLAYDWGLKTLSEQRGSYEKPAPSVIIGKHIPDNSSTQDHRLSERALRKLNEAIVEPLRKVVGNMVNEIAEKILLLKKCGSVILYLNNWEARANQMQGRQY